MVAGMRNYIVHEYFQVDDNVVWDVVTHDLPVLEKQITAYIILKNWQNSNGVGF